MAQSQYEKDLARRQRSSGKKPREGPDRRIWYGLGAAAVVAITLVATMGGGPAVTREANLAAFGLDDDPFLGSPAAPVVLVGFESLSCSSCQHFHRSVLPSLQPLFDDGSLVYYHVATPLYDAIDIHFGNVQECALAISNEAFWDLTDRAYAGSLWTTTGQADAALRAVAIEHGADGDAAVECAGDKDHQGRVSEDWRKARQFGAPPTPTFYMFGPDGEAVTVQRDQIAAATAELSP